MQPKNQKLIIKLINYDLYLLYISYILSPLINNKTKYILNSCRNVALWRVKYLHIDLNIIKLKLLRRVESNLRTTVETQVKTVYNIYILDKFEVILPFIWISISYRYWNFMILRWKNSLFTIKRRSWCFFLGISIFHFSIFLF